MARNFKVYFCLLDFLLLKNWKQVTGRSTIVSVLFILRYFTSPFTILILYAVIIRNNW